MKARERYLIEQLKKMNIHNNSENQPIEQLNYETLKSMLAIKRAAAQ